MPRQALRLMLLLLTAVFLGSCDEPASSSSVSRLASSPSAVLNLTGTWSGTATDSSGQVQLIWEVTHTGANLTGPVRAVSNVGLQLYRGSVAGTVAGNRLTFTVTVETGGIENLPECSLTLSGQTTDLQAASLAGTYAGTHSCSGAVSGGRLLLIKQ